MDFKEIIYAKADGIATIKLNRPEALNAFTPTMIEEWVTAIETAKQDEDVRVLVVTGTGRGFCAGMDLTCIVAAEGAPRRTSDAHLEDGAAYPPRPGRL